VIERINEIARWLKEKWLGVALPLLGILVIALGVRIIRTTTEDFFGGLVVVFGGLLMFGLFWLVQG